MPLKTYQLVIEDPRGIVIRINASIDTKITNVYKYCKNVVRKYYGKEYMLCDYYEV